MLDSEIQKTWELIIPHNSFPMQIINWASLLLVTWETVVAAELPIVDLGYQRHQAIGFNVSPIPRKRNERLRNPSDDQLNDIPSRLVAITNFLMSVMPNPR